MERLSRNVASALTKKGFQHGDILFFVTYDIVNMGIMQMAVWMLGGATRGSFQQETIGNVKNIYLSGKANKKFNFKEEFARQMMEVKCKFVAVDSKTASMIQGAIEICNFDCEMINVGDIPVQDTIEFSDLSTDDGLGKYLFTSEITACGLLINNLNFLIHPGFPEKVVINPKETILAITTTSGSTGVPKGVVHSHFSYVSCLACFE